MNQHSHSAQGRSRHIILPCFFQTETMKKLFIFLIPVFFGCTKDKERSIIGTWEVTYPSQFIGDQWVFAGDFKVYRDSALVYQEDDWSIPDVDLSFRADVNLMIFDENYLSYALNNPGYDTTQFFQGTATITDKSINYCSIWDRNNCIILKKIR